MCFGFCLAESRRSVLPLWDCGCKLFARACNCTISFLRHQNRLLCRSLATKRRNWQLRLCSVWLIVMVTCWGRDGKIYLTVWWHYTELDYYLTHSLRWRISYSQMAASNSSKRPRTTTPGSVIVTCYALVPCFPQRQNWVFLSRNKALDVVYEMPVSRCSHWMVYSHPLFSTFPCPIVLLHSVCIYVSVVIYG